MPATAGWGQWATMAAMRPTRAQEAAQNAVEMTIDQLAARVGMTVRNVRAYAGRGLIPAPRLVGRTGYYTEQHAARLQLVRDLVERGYTLTAVEKALADKPHLTDSHALDLLTLLSNPLGAPVEPEELSVDELARLAGVEHDERFVEQLAQLGLVEVVGDDTVRLLRPVLVRAGAQALALGLSRTRVLGLFDDVSAAMSGLAGSFVSAFIDDVWHPFLEQGMPEDRWPEIISRIESILPVVSQAALAAFRHELTNAIEHALGEELGTLTGEQVDRLLGPA